MTTKNNRPQKRDRPRWRPPGAAQSMVMTPELHDALPDTVMLRGRAQIEGTRETIPVVFRRVSANKYAVTTGSGFSAKKLYGAQVVSLVRVDDEVAT